MSTKAATVSASILAALCLALLSALPGTAHANGAVGAAQYVQWINLAFAVFDKTTGVSQAH